MKHIKMLGLAAVMTATLAMIFGPDAVTATVLCKESKTTGCASGGQAYPSGTVLEATLKSGSTASLEAGGFIEDTCTGSTLKATTSTAGSSTSTVGGSASSLTWSGCTNPTTTTKLGSLEFHWVAGNDLAWITFSGFNWTVLTFSSCVWSSGTGNLVGSLIPGSPATIRISTTVTSTSGGFCPSNATWNAEYVVTKPTPLFAAES